MMFSKLQFGLMAGVLALSVSAGVAFAALSADDAIKGRRACMKMGHGGVLAVAVPMFKGEKPFDAAALKTAFDAEDAACKDWAMWWGPDTQKGDKETTHAKAEIWTDPKGFEAASGAWYAADQKLRAATDLASFKAAFPALGKGCQGCHEKFRAPLE
jgi:cytochrome c556